MVAATASIEPASKAAIPEAFLDLVNGPPVAALATVMPDGRPQTTVVWCNFDGTHPLINTMRGFRKERNMRLNPRVTLLCYDPYEPLRSLEVRGTVVEVTEEGALQHLDRLARLYTGRSPYFGECVPAELRDREIPVLCRILPTRVVTLDARGESACKEPRAQVTGDSSNAARSSHISPRGVMSGQSTSILVPAGHLDLLERPVHGVFTTMMPSGQPECSLVWCDYDGACARINTTLQRRKGKNVVVNPKVSLLVVDPEDTSRYIEIRGDAEIVEEGAIEHLDGLTRRYTRHPQFYGYVYQREQQAKETRIICRIHATKISLDAIHRG